jgi:drug/metabolite transporter (DMT)-like permease
MAAPEGSGPLESTDLIGAGLVGLTSVLFGSVVVLGSVVTRSGLPVPSFLAFRFAVAALLLAGALAVARLPLAAAKGEGWRLGLLGGVAYAAESGFFFAALGHGTAAAVTLLFFTYPVIVSVLALATGRGESGWLIWGAMALAVAGAALVVLTGHGVQIDRLGVVFALTSAGTFALYLTAADVVLKRTNSLAGAMWVSASAATGLAAYALVRGAAQWPDGLHQWAPVLATAVATAGAFFCLFAGLRRLGAVRTSIVSATEPLAAAVLAAIFIHQPIRAGVAAGGVLILAGAVTASVGRRRVPAEPPVP